MNQEKRLLLALVLSMIVCGIWGHMMSVKQRERMEKQKKAQRPPTQKKIIIPTETPVVAPPVIAAPANIFSAQEERIEVTTEKYWMQWSNKGAALQVLKLKEFYHDSADRNAKDWKKDPANWLELLPEFSGKFPSLLVIDRDDVKQRLEESYWKVTNALDQTPKKLIFELGHSEGIRYTKTFTFFPDTYFFNGELVVKNGSDNPALKKILILGGGAGIALEGSDINMMVGQVMYPNQKGQPLFESIDYNSMATEKTKVEKPITWAALTTSYFVHMLQLEQPPGVGEKTPYLITHLNNKSFTPETAWVQRTIEAHKKRGETRTAADFEKVKHVLPMLHTRPLDLQPHQEISIKFRFYAGSRIQLTNLDKTFKVLDDYGFWDPISRFLLLILNFFYNIFHNYGIAIILLTLVVKLCMFPLTKKQQVSMQEYQQKMRKFQPQMQKLQEKYRDNRQKMQEEIMKLYKEHKVNPIPLGGCLPIFLQIPILIGLYNALAYSIVLRQAEFLWINDLSQPDRIFHFGSSVFLLGEYLNILPIVMTVVWVVQMKTAPMPEDPQMRQQQKIMMWMPIIFGISFYNISSGLVLYWFVMQLISIVEQAWIKRLQPKTV